MNLTNLSFATIIASSFDFLCMNKEPYPQQITAELATNYEQASLLDNIQRRAREIGSIALASLALATNSGSAEARYDVSSGPNRTDRVMLTYDDCPDNLSSFRNVVQYVDRKNIGLGIFPTGLCQKSFRNRYGANLAQIARKHGQYVGNHSFSHPDLRRLSFGQVVDQIDGKVQSSYDRPPFGAVNETVKEAYKHVGMRRWHWDVDTRDWEGKSESQVVSYVINNAGKGDTVLMHLQWNGFSVSAIKDMVRGLRNQRGLKVCRAWRGRDGVGEVEKSPIELPNRLSC